MANTRQSTKRAKQAKKRQVQNGLVKSVTKSAVKLALEAFKSADVEKAKEAYKGAIKALAKAGSKGAIPKGRASRKISRLTAFALKTLPKALPFTSEKGSSKK